MSKPAFSPGPWKSITTSKDVNGDDSWDVYMDSRDIPDGHRLFVCEYISVEANARLIAAAPDLYEACESAAESLRWLIENAIDCGCEGGGISEPEHLCGYHKSLFALEDAAKKARGESSVPA